MPHVECSALVHADVEKLFAVARDIERYPEFMPDVKSVRIVERDGGRVVSDWVSLISEFRIEVKWSEEDVWDDVAHTCRFRQLKGDFQQYEGIWHFEPTPDGTQMRMEIEYRYDVPLIGPLLKALVARLMKQNMEAILAALKKQAEGA